MISGSMRSATLLIVLAGLTACGSANGAAPASSPPSSPAAAAAASAAAKPAASTAPSAAAKPAASAAAKQAASAGASAAAKPSASAAAAPKPSGPLLKIATGVGSPTSMFAYLASDAGIYAKNGVNVETQTAAGQTQMDAVIAGEATGTMHAGADLVFTSEASGQVDLQIVFTGSRLDDDLLLAKPEITSVEQLKGKKVGMQSTTSVNGQMARRLLAKYGLQEGKDYQVILTGTQGSTAGALAALVSGAVDATAVSESLAAPAIKQGQIHTLVDIATRTDLPTGSQVMVFPTKFVQSNPDAVQKVVDSLIDAIHMVYTDKAAAEAVLRTHYKISDQQQLDDAWARAKQVLSKDPTPKREDFAEVISNLPKDVKPLSDDTIDGMLNQKFAKDAISRGLTNY
jgi:NitT/TauT family transport system substrate-binding protein